ncbi:uncharacterized protein [Argopecten irradians]|uniref:uncharacterized protein n=1 Tax=Argopecten irradians TaxID=31199 RepID=UPI0037213782
MALFTFLAIFGMTFASSHAYECDKTASVCETTLVIEKKLTMMHDVELQVYPYNGKIYKYDVVDPQKATPIPTEEVMTADGWEENRLVVVANETLSGPPIIVYKGQRVIVHVINKLYSDTVTIHWHGLHQRGTPWMDGVPFVTQCPILPNQKYTYDFTPEQSGSYWYHSHVGNQRTKGINGAFVIRERNQVMKEHIMTVQDWNHFWGADMDHLKLKYGDFWNRIPEKTRMSVDGGFFDPFYATSVLINGRGRYYSNTTTGENNGAPLSVFQVDKGDSYRFRVINVGAIYPIRVSVDDHSLTIVASDGYDVKPVDAESFIINPGERYDFIITANQTVGNYWIRAETLEIKLHRVEAILRYQGAPEVEPTSSRRTCTPTDKCLVVNCPFSDYPVADYTNCLRFDHLRSATNNDPAPEPTSADTFKEHFLNFALPTEVSSINGIEFEDPTVNVLTQPFEIETSCDKTDCGEDKTCTCTHSLATNHNDVVQLVFMNMGIGTGDAHPVHLHGYSFYVLKMGYATYNMTTAKYISPNKDINCRGGGDDVSYCNSATWRDSSWLGNNIPGLELKNAPRKDTLIIPSGGYAVVRIKADNPGVWIMHCHIQYHATLGMKMVLNSSYPLHPTPPLGLPVCHDFPPSPYRQNLYASQAAAMSHGTSAPHQSATHPNGMTATPPSYTGNGPVVGRKRRESGKLDVPEHKHLYPRKEFH